jgi:hypothetical protein
MFKLVYGDYEHDAGEVELVNVSKRTTHSPRGYRQTTRETWQIQGILQAADESSVKTKIAALQAAYSQDKQDVDFRMPDGSSSAHYMRTANTVDGVRVRELSFPEGKGAEHSTYRTYRITLEADYDETSNETDAAGQSVLKFEESIMITGTGGPKFKFLPTINGLPIKQQVQQRTTMKIVQSGQAVGRTFAAMTTAVPLPLIPSAEHLDRRNIGYPTRSTRLGVVQEYPVTWTYYMEFVNPVSVTGPNVL